MGEKVAMKHHNNTSIEQVPKDVLVNIMLRLSSKDLGRCICTSKLWNYSLAIEVFMLRHSRSPAADFHSITTLYPHRSSPPEPFRLLSFMIPSTNNNASIKNPKYLPAPMFYWFARNYGSVPPKLIGNFKTLPTFLQKFDRFSNICHGLACLFKYTIESPSQLSIVLLSIRTCELITLPKTTNYAILNPSIKLIYASSSVGFDPLKKDCLIFRRTLIKTADQNYRILYETLRLGSPAWNQIDDAKVPSLLSQGICNLYRRELHRDGVIYWIHDIVRSYRPRDVSYALAAFDMSKEEFRYFGLNHIVVERDPFDNFYPLHLASVRGCPTLFAKQNNGRNELWAYTLLNHKKANAAWNQSVSIMDPWEIFNPYDIVCEGQFRIKQTQFRNGSNVVNVIYLLCQDLESKFCYGVEIMC